MKRQHNFIGVTCIATGVAVLLLTGGWVYEHPMSLVSTHHYAELGEEYNPYQYFSFLFLAGNEEVEVVGGVDTGTKGDYAVTLQARSQRIPVKVTVKDSQPPAVTLKEVTTDKITELKAEDFIEDITDAQDYTVSFAKDTVLTKTGKTKVSLIVEDADHNRAECQTTLTRVDDVTPPVVKGVEATYNLIMGKQLDTADIRVSDDLDPNPTIDINTKGIDTSTEGEYELVVTAKDKSGNETKLTRPVNVIENPEYQKNIVYLTFDDGPSSNTKKILDILDKYDVKATFFVTAQYPNYAHLIRDEKLKGHTVALHTYCHDYDRVYKSEKDYFEDLNRIQEYVKKYTGEESQLIRFPGGSSNTISAMYSQGIMSRLTKQVTDKGYQYFDWNVSSSDATGFGVPASEIVKSACVKDSGNLVILMHDTVGKETTVEALPKIIEYYKNRGFEFRALTTESYPAHHGVNN